MRATSLYFSQTGRTISPTPSEIALLTHSTHPHRILGPTARDQHEWPDPRADPDSKEAILQTILSSCKRLVPGFEAPVMLAYSARNRSASIRIPYEPSPKGKRIEVRFPDPTANPYLAFAAMLMAGIDGIQNKIHPGDAADKDLYDLPAEEAADIPTVASSLEMALDALEADRDFLTAGGVFTDDMIDAYIELKREDVERLNMTTHPVEFDLYYSL